VAIPKIIHQTTATVTLPEWCQPLHRRIVRLHPDWDHRVYDDDASRDLFRRELPHLLPLYDNYAFNIQRADVFRVAALFLSGGFYLDWDIDCYKPLDSLCEYPCVLAEEKTLDGKEAADLGHENVFRVANYMFGSEPGYPFWLDVMDEMRRRARRPIVSQHDILESTGPGLLTDVYHRVTARYPDLVVLKNDHLTCRTCGVISCHFGDFASHLHVGSWRGILAAVASTAHESRTAP
jgi:mannosyltransferase OCH1-like enzyme